MVPPSPEPIRPALKLLTGACVVGLAVLSFLLLYPHHRRATSRAEGQDTARGHGRHGFHQGPRWSEPGGSGNGGGTAGPAANGGPGDEQEDPQMLASYRTYPPSDGGVGTPPFVATYRGGRIDQVVGDAPVSVGERCELRVLPVRDARYNCLVRVMCGGVVLYPNAAQTAGYAPCDVENGVPMRSVDQNYTPADGDPRVEVDLPDRRVRVSDGDTHGQRFAATLRLDPALWM